MQKVKETLVKEIIFMRSQLEKSTEKQELEEEPKLSIEETDNDKSQIFTDNVQPTMKQFIDYCISMQIRQAQRDLNF